MKLNEKQYECDICHLILDLVETEEWSTEKAKLELLDKCGEFVTDNQPMACDTCYKNLMDSYNDE